MVLIDCMLAGFLLGHGDNSHAAKPPGRQPVACALQANAPSAVAGCEFDSLSFGSSAIQIVGVKNSSFRTGADQLGIVLDIDVRWAGQPGAKRAMLQSDDSPTGAAMNLGSMRAHRVVWTADITLKLQPSRKWMIKQMKIGAAFCSLSRAL